MLLKSEIYSVSEVLGGDKAPLALHRWAPQNRAEARGLLYYIHGIQSHASWLFETGPELALRGVITYVLDRRGSGISGGSRGDLPSADVVVDDYLHGLHAAQQECSGLPLTILGQSFGGSIVASLAATRDIDADTIVYCTPALGQQRVRHDAVGLADIRQLAGLERSPIALDDEDYTNEVRYLEFMANDHLMLRQVTDRTRATMVKLEDSYVDRQVDDDKATSIYFVRTDFDPIIDLDASEKLLRDLHGEFTAVTFPIRHHYVEFTTVRRDYWDWLADVVVRSGGDRRGWDS